MSSTLRSSAGSSLAPGLWMFVEHFALLAPQAAAPAVGSLRHRCAALLAVVLPQQASYRMGTSLVFLGQGVLASLERARAVRLARAAVAVQRRQRGCLARAAWRRARSSVARIQRSWRTAHGRIAPPPSLSRERTPSEPVVPTTRAQPVEQVGVGAPPGSELRSRAAHAQAVSESASRLAAELAKLQALALASPTLDERALLAEAVVREEELQNLEADNSALAAANVELQSEVDELIGDLVPTKLLLAHAEDEKAAMLRELHTLAAKLGAAETELELMRQAAASRAGNFGLFAARR
ncbi:hypothetical protein T492DRAFT_848208 [Pavlovales sp. CCMP2436]|nr:hypothetical protein T492DRAFT_848208 [Pavlovales sp. CCMP2436]